MAAHAEFMHVAFAATETFQALVRAGQAHLAPLYLSLQQLVAAAICAATATRRADMRCWPELASMCVAVMLRHTPCAVVCRWALLFPHNPAVCAIKQHVPWFTAEYVPATLASLSSDQAVNVLSRRITTTRRQEANDPSRHFARSPDNGMFCRTPTGIHFKLTTQIPLIAYLFNVPLVFIVPDNADAPPMAVGSVAIDNDRFDSIELHTAVPGIVELPRSMKQARGRPIDTHKIRVCGALLLGCIPCVLVIRVQSSNSKAYSVVFAPPSDVAMFLDPMTSTLDIVRRGWRQWIAGSPDDASLDQRDCSMHLPLVEREITQENLVRVAAILSAAVGSTDPAKVAAPLVAVVRNIQTALANLSLGHTQTLDVSRLCMRTSDKNTVLPPAIDVLLAAGDSILVPATACFALS